MRRTEYSICNCMLYVKKYSRLPGKEGDSMKNEATPRKIWVIFRKERYQYPTMTSRNKRKCPQGDCSWEGECITHLTDLRINGLELNTATMCDCGRHFNRLWRLHINKTQWYKQCNLLIEECKLNNGMTNPDYIHNIQDPIVDHQYLTEILSRPRIQWPKSKQRAIWSYLDQVLSIIVANHLKCPMNELIILKWMWQFHKLQQK